VGGGADTTLSIHHLSADSFLICIDLQATEAA